jgi:hypothetical protein
MRQVVAARRARPRRAAGRLYALGGARAAPGGGRGPRTGARAPRFGTARGPSVGGPARPAAALTWRGWPWYGVGCVRRTSGSVGGAGGGRSFELARSGLFACPPRFDFPPRPPALPPRPIARTSPRDRCAAAARRGASGASGASGVWRGARSTRGAAQVCAAPAARGARAWQGPRAMTAAAVPSPARGTGAPAPAPPAPPRPQSMWLTQRGRRRGAGGRRRRGGRAPGSAPRSAPWRRRRARTGSCCSAPAGAEGMPPMSRVAPHEVSASAAGAKGGQRPMAPMRAAALCMGPRAARGGRAARAWGRRARRAPHPAPRPIPPDPMPCPGRRRALFVPREGPPAPRRRAPAALRRRPAPRAGAPRRGRADLGAIGWGGGRGRPPRRPTPASSPGLEHPRTPQGATLNTEHGTAHAVPARSAPANARPARAPACARRGARGRDGRPLNRFPPLLRPSAARSAGGRRGEQASTQRPGSPRPRGVSGRPEPIWRG